MHVFRNVIMIWLLSTSSVLAEDFRPFNFEAFMPPEERARLEAERARAAAEQIRMDTAKSCEELYVEIRQLYGQSYTSSKGYWENPINQTILLASTLITPAYYGLVYTGALDFKQGMDADTRRQRLDVLRHYSARKRCFSG